MKMPILYKILRPIITVLVKIFFHPEIKGKENIPLSEGAIIVSNHTSYFDPLLLIATTKRNIHFLAKHTLDKGFKKIIFHHMGIIFVNRSIKNPEAVKQAIDLGKKKQIIAIFPEGTINKTNEVIMPFKIGALKIAHDADIPIIPVAIQGKYHLFKNNLRIILANPYRIKTDDLEKEKQKLEEKICNLLERK